MDTWESPNFSLAPSRLWFIAFLFCLRIRLSIETLGSSLDLTVAALRALGFRAYEAQRAARFFRDYDEESVRALAPYAKNEKELISQARERIQTLEQLMEAERSQVRYSDTGWNLSNFKRRAKDRQLERRSRDSGKPRA
jgi:hypothetical protein